MRARLWAAVTIVALAMARRQAAGQLPIDAHVEDRAAAGFEVERYLRALQVAGVAPLYPWSVRGFGPLELNALVPADTTHPWVARLRRDTGRLKAYLLAPQASLIYNSTYPYGYNDGPLWAGRGLTADVQFGFGARAGPLSLVVDPEIFRAWNGPFTLQPNGFSGRLAFADPYNPTSIDQPQRFGSTPYQRIDPGQSTLRLDLGPVAAGASTADEFWGPAVSNPIILGNNAAGFPHAFLGTAHPLNLWLITVQTRAIWGQLQESDYSADTSTDTRRFGTGVVGTVTIRGLPGLELGASRFYHEQWPAGGPHGADITLPFTIHNFAAAHANLVGQGVPTNQLASLFGRWVFPSAGLEAYGEFGRDDFNVDVYDLIAEPDHISSYLIGLLRTYDLGRHRLFVLRAEVLNSRITHLANVRVEAPWYVHTPIVQGHTQLGQVLGSIGAKGGGAADLAGDLYTPGGRWTVEWGRRLVNDIPPSPADLLHVLTVDRLWFRRRFDVHAAVSQIVEFNRRPDVDVGNLSLQIGAIAHW